MTEKKLAWTFNCPYKIALQSRRLLSVNTAEYTKEKNKNVDICAKIHIYLTVLITQWECL